MQWYLPVAGDDFPDLGGWIIDRGNDAVIWLVINAGWFFEGVSNTILQPLLWLEQMLRGAPPWVIIVVFGLIAYAASRKLRVALLIVSVTYLLGALQLWEQSMQTIAIMIVAVLLAILIGLPLGIMSARGRA